MRSGETRGPQRGTKIGTAARAAAAADESGKRRKLGTRLVHVGAVCEGGQQLAATAAHDTQSRAQGGSGDAAGQGTRELERTVYAPHWVVIRPAFAAKARRSIDSSSLLRYDLPSVSFHELNAMTISVAENFSACPAASAASRAAVISSASSMIEEEAP